MGLRFRRGYTIADSLVALVIVVLAAVGLVGVVPYSFDQTQHNAIDVQATAAAQQFLDVIRYDIQNGVPVPSSTTAPIDYGQTFNGSTASPTSGNFSLSSSCTALTGPSQDCSVTVQWTADGGTARSLSFETYVTGKI